MRGIDWLIALIVFVVALLPYAGITEHELVADGQRIVGANPLVLENRWSDMPSATWWGSTGVESEGFVDNLYRPLTVAWFAWFYDAPGDAGGLAAGNAFLHGLGAALRYLLVVLLFAGRPWRRVLGFGAAAFAGVHALSAEGVLGQVGAAELLVQVLLLVCWILFSLGLRRGGGRRVAAWGLAGGAWFLALLAKESAFVFPIVLFVQALLFAPAPGAEEGARDGEGAAPDLRTPRAAFLAACASMIPFVAALAGVWSLRVSVLGEFAPFAETGVFRGFSVGARVATAFAVQAEYARAFFSPFGLAPVITHDVVRPAASLADPRALAGLSVWLVGAAGTVVALARRCPAGLFGLAAAATMLPASNLIFGIGAVGGYRFVYSPVAFVVVALGAGIALVAERRRLLGRIATGLALLLALAGFWGTRVLVAAWSNQSALTRHAYELDPRDPFALQNFAVEHFLNALQGARSSDDGFVAEVDAFHARFDAIEPDLATVPGTDRLPEHTRILCSRLLANHGKVKALRAQLAATDRAAFERHADAAVEKLARATAYNSGRPASWLRSRLTSIELRSDTLATLSQGGVLDVTTLGLAIEELRVLVGETKLFVEAHRAELPAALRAVYEFESARFATLEDHVELVAARLARVYAIDPLDPKARSFEVDLLLRRGQPRIALRRLEELIDAGRATVSVFARAANVAGQLGDGAKRSRYLQRLLSIPARSPQEAQYQDMARQQLANAGRR